MYRGRDNERCVLQWLMGGGEENDVGSDGAVLDNQVGPLDVSRSTLGDKQSATVRMAREDIGREMRNGS